MFALSGIVTIISLKKEIITLNTMAQHGSFSTRRTSSPGQQIDCEHKYNDFFRGPSENDGKKLRRKLGNVRGHYPWPFPGNGCPGNYHGCNARHQNNNGGFRSNHLGGEYAYSIHNVTLVTLLGLVVTAVLYAYKCKRKNVTFPMNVVDKERQMPKICLEHIYSNPV